VRLEDLQRESIRSAIANAQNPQAVVAYGCTIYAVEIEGDLRSTFYIEGDCVVSVDIGTHDIYKG
jgi:hypothetical protein